MKKKMKAAAELAFNGNCAEALALCERAFKIKTEQFLRYKDAPAEDGSSYPEGTGNFVMRARLKLGGDAFEKHVEKAAEKSINVLIKYLGAIQPAAAPRP